ncbi:MAG: biopolymer transporter ExbD [Bacteroidia bacterium]
MAILIQNTTATKGRIRKHDLHIDFTPMVDLGFLLITFFMLTTSLNALHKLTITLPEEDKGTSTPSPIKASQAFTVIMSGDNKVYWYTATEVNKLSSTDFSKNGIEKILKEKSLTVNSSLDSISFYEALYDNKKISKEDLQHHINHFANDKRNIFVFIKAMPKAKYQNLISIIDALNKNNIRHYAIDDLNESEKQIMSRTD